MKDDAITNELGMIYENFVLNEMVKLQDLKQDFKKKSRKGMTIFQIILDSLPEYIGLFGAISSLAFACKVHKMYEYHPEILAQHIEYKDKAAKEIAQYISDHPAILKFFLDKR